MTTPNEPAASAEHLSLAELLERMTHTLEATGAIDMAEWIRVYPEWNGVIHQLSPLILEIQQLAPSEAIHRSSNRRSNLS